MRWIFIGIALGIGFMLAPYLVSAIWMVLQTTFLLIGVAAWKTWPWVLVPMVAGVLFLSWKADA